MTDTRIAPRTPRDADVQSAADQALAWVARQLGWERTLAALRAGRQPEPARTTRRAA